MVRGLAMVWHLMWAKEECTVYLLVPFELEIRCDEAVEGCHLDGGSQGQVKVLGGRQRVIPPHKQMASLNV